MRLRTLIPLFVLLLVVTSCGGGDESADGAADPGGGTVRHSSSHGRSRAGTTGANEGDSGGNATVVLENVIRTATLVLQTTADSLDDAINDAAEVGTDLGGSTLDSVVDPSDAEASIEIRIPAGEFDSALSRLQGLGTLVEREVGARVVDGELVDLGARLRNWRAHEAAILEIMTQASTIEETFHVQDELSNVRLEIERIEGRLAYLRDQVALSTITVRFVSPTAQSPALKPPSILAEAWDTTTEGVLRSLGVLLVITGVSTPFISLGLLIWLIARKVQLARHPAAPV
ncbi:MAG TPA: DUF4349 domain-containing protein [Actinomycetota bacterium]|nr:DUF4349 domain-containing protein [Actinomycetota bacterium]